MRGSGASEKETYRFTLKEDKQAKSIARNLGKESKYKNMPYDRRLSIGYATVQKRRHKKR